MKKLLSILAVLFITGCASTSSFVDTKVVTKTEYVIRKATDEQKAIPPYTDMINPDTASQSDLAEWITASEERQWRLETIIQELVKFYERPVTPTETK